MSWNNEHSEERPRITDEGIEEQQPPSSQKAESEQTSCTKSTNKNIGRLEAKLERCRRFSDVSTADLSKPRNKKLTGLQNRIKEVGRSILGKICHQTENLGRVRPTMIPPTPNITFIDEFPDGDILEEVNLATRELQEGYEAEVKLYRRLEELQESVLVVHGLEFTHDQCSAFLPIHSCSNSVNCSNDVIPHPCHKSTKELEGEWDFVLIGDNHVALFEVKGVNFAAESDPSNEVRFRGSYGEAVRQIERIKEFIKAINDRVEIFEFIVFSNLTLNECLPFIGEKNNFSKSVLDSLVFSDDLDNFNSWYDSKVKQKVSRVELDLTVLRMNLLGLWCINADNTYDIASCNLNKCVLEMNDQLKRAYKEL